MPVLFPDPKWPPQQRASLANYVQGFRKLLARKLYYTSIPLAQHRRYAHPTGIVPGPVTLPGAYAVSVRPLLISLTAYDGTPIEFVHNLGFVPIDTHVLLAPYVELAITTDQRKAWTNQRIFFSIQLSVDQATGLPVAGAQYPVRVKFLLY